MKSVIVTGATSGIGFETARGIVQKGDKLIVINRSRQKWDRCYAELLQECPNANISAYFADLSSMHQIREVCSEIIQNHPVIDILINNAGILRRDSLTHLNVDDIRKQFEKDETFVIFKNRSGGWNRRFRSVEA